ALFSGGLDSLLAVKIVELAGVEVIPVFFSSPFFGPEKAIKTARNNNLNLVIVELGEEYLEVVKNPKYGYGKYMNPCIDCHAFMFRKLGGMLEKYEADFLISGEVLGQRPMSQVLPSLNAVRKLSGYYDLIVRPLSQKLLPDTLPIRKGWISKDRLYDIRGRNRKRQFELAEKFGIEKYPSPAGGCLLTNPGFVQRLRDLLEHDMFDIENIELLKVGRHFRISKSIKLVLGRNKFENDKLFQIRSMGESIVHVDLVNVKGPAGIVSIKKHSLYELCDPEMTELCGGILLSYINRPGIESATIFFRGNRFFKVSRCKKMGREEAREYLINK
ncbi:MAG: hypothetical protein J7K33_05550, partial [Candidatus Marinimicrobia bacterium]|nr:hypothetical protein [Candidatus Neomarinimicrobiota bacterium]